MQTPSATQLVRDVDVLGALLEERCARIQSAEVDPISRLVTFTCEILDAEKAEEIADAFARRNLQVDAKTYSAILRDLYRRVRDARLASGNR